MLGRVIIIKQKHCTLIKGTYTYMAWHCIAVKQFYLQLELKNKKALELQKLQKN